MAKRTGHKRTRATRGPKGRRGERGAPGISPDDLHALMETVEALRAEAALQLRRIADLQAQLDIVSAQFRRLKSATRH